MGNFNSLIFPKPEPSYTIDHPNLYFIPKNSVSQKKIPVIFLKKNKNAKKVLIYFHGNAEDINIALPFVDYTCNVIRAHGLIIEYPTYGVYNNNTSLSEENINKDAESVYDFLINEMGFEKDEIILLGRSMGSGPATSLASKKEIKYLLLFSPYTSIKNVSKDHVGFMSMFVKERFKNIDLISKNTNPCLIIHGKKDNIIPYEHSIQLYEKCGATMKKLINPDSMNHNYFRIDQDLCIPMMEFEEKIDFIKKKITTDSETYINFDVLKK
jgi:predicted esterase